MTLALTLLCRDEADILEPMLRFHLERGVDLIIATDNGSVDGSLEILQRFERGGRLRLLQEPDHTHDQAVWVTRMARMAAELGADWIINSDADEFWWPENGNLATTLAALPDSIEAVEVNRTNFIPPQRKALNQRPFYECQTLRERVSVNSRGEPLPPKMIHRADQKINVSDGNHIASIDGRRLNSTSKSGIEILHLPIRSFAQLERKIKQGSEALQRNSRVGPNVGDNWHRIYNNHLKTGTLAGYYDSLVPDEQSMQVQLINGDLILDQRLQQALGKQVPRVAVITPYYQEPIDQLEQCHHSVLEQNEPCMHVLVADGHPQPKINQWQAEHVQLPRSHGDIGSTPRLIGCYHAIGLGVDAVAFLDADNWYRQDHISNLLEAIDQQKADFASSGRTLCRLDGSVMGPCPLTNPQTFIDTNAMLFGRTAFHLLHQWVLMPDYGHLIGDRIMLHHVHKSDLKHQHTHENSVFYRCNKAGLYRQLNEPIPSQVSPQPNYAASFKKWKADGNEPL